MTLWFTSTFLFYVLSSASALSVQPIDKRSPQTEAVCSTDYEWATSSQQLSPCLLTAFVWGACFTDNWDVIKLTPGNSYAVPNVTTGTANLCTCSWAAYNLISACTACQGFSPAIVTWASYEQNCGNFLTNTYFPDSVILAAHTTIPYWAAVNPRNWQDGRFNTAQAQALAQQGKPDFVPGSSTPKHKTPIGAIVGGVVGGLAALVLGGAIVFCLFFKHKRQPQSQDVGLQGHLSRPPLHMRSWSDFSSKSVTVPPSVSVAISHSQRPGTVYTTNTMHTHDTSVHSLSYAPSAYTSPVRVLSPPLTHLQPTEEVIEPYTHRPTSPPVSTIPRKASETTMRTAYQSQDAASTITGMVHQRTESESSDQPRLNPPAYTPYPSPTASPEPSDPTPLAPLIRAGPHPRHEKGSPSIDSQQSYNPHTSHDGHESMSGFSEVVGRMGLTLGPESAVGAHTVSTGQSGNVVMHKPTVSNPDPQTP